MGALRLAPQEYSLGQAVVVILKAAGLCWVSITLVVLLGTMAFAPEMMDLLPAMGLSAALLGGPFAFFVLPLWGGGYTLLGFGILFTVGVVGAYILGRSLTGQVVPENPREARTYVVGWLAIWCFIGFIACTVLLLEALGPTAIDVLPPISERPPPWR